MGQVMDVTTNRSNKPTNRSNKTTNKPTNRSTNKPLSKPESGKLALIFEFEYYQKYKQYFVDNYEGRYIVLVGKKFLGSYPTQMKAIKAARKKHELGTFLVKYVRQHDPVQIIPRMIIPKEEQ